MVSLTWRGAAEIALWAILIGSVGYCGTCIVLAESTRLAHPVHPQRRAADIDGNILGSASSGYSGGASIPDGSVVGELSIPALGLSAPVVEGLTRQDLIRGVGHVPRSANAGGLGNIVLAAHRDTFFRPLRNVKAGMQVRVADSEFVYRYQVDSTEIVLPDQVSVLDEGELPQVTLITCYPFDYIGAAPKRFIVHAHLTSLIPNAVSRQP